MDDLLALMLLQDSRRAARLDVRGEAGLDQVMRHAAAASERRLIRSVLDRLPPTGSGAAGGA